jgi:hypothetical protein
VAVVVFVFVSCCWSLLFVVVIVRVLLGMIVLVSCCWSLLDVVVIELVRVIVSAMMRCR